MILELAVPSWCWPSRQHGLATALGKKPGRNRWKGVRLQFAGLNQTQAILTVVVEGKASWTISAISRCRNALRWS